MIVNPFRIDNFTGIGFDKSPWKPAQLFVLRPGKRTRLKSPNDFWLVDNRGFPVILKGVIAFLKNVCGIFGKDANVQNMFRGNGFASLAAFVDG